MSGRERASAWPRPVVARGRGLEPRLRDPKSLVLPVRRSPTTLSLLTADDAPHCVRGGRFWCRGPESNWGHRDFQSLALPTELPRHLERARGFEPPTFSLARRRSTTELHPHIFRFRWTRPDSNRRSPPCKGGAFPTRPRAHTGKAPRPYHGADERTRTSTPRRAADPKSAASTGSATSAPL